MDSKHCISNVHDISHEAHTLQNTHSTCQCLGAKCKCHETHTQVSPQTTVTASGPELRSPIQESSSIPSERQGFDRQHHLELRCNTFAAVVNAKGEARSASVALLQVGRPASVLVEADESTEVEAGKESIRLEMALPTSDLEILQVGRPETAQAPPADPQYLQVGRPEAAQAPSADLEDVHFGSSGI